MYKYTNTICSNTHIHCQIRPKRSTTSRTCSFWRPYCVCTTRPILCSYCVQIVFVLQDNVFVLPHIVFVLPYCVYCVLPHPDCVLPDPERFSFQMYEVVFVDISLSDLVLSRCYAQLFVTDQRTVL